jgi:hypothetical protein
MLRLLAFSRSLFALSARLRKPDRDSLLSTLNLAALARAPALSAAFLVPAHFILDFLARAFRILAGRLLFLSHFYSPNYARNARPRVTFSGHEDLETANEKPQIPLSAPPVVRGGRGSPRIGVGNTGRRKRAFKGCRSDNCNFRPLVPCHGGNAHPISTLGEVDAYHPNPRSFL